MSLIGRKQKGFECEENPDGSQTCRRFVIHKGRKMATGSDFELIPDPNTCKVRFNGSEVDDDKDSINEKIAEVENKCKRGF